MKRLTTLSLIAIAAAAMIAVPLDAQTRGGSNSRSGSGGGSSRSSSGGGRPSSSMSAPSSQMRGSGSAGNTKGLSSTPRSSQPSISRSTPGGGQPSRSGSNARSSSSGSTTRQSMPSTGSSGTVSRGSVQQQRLPDSGPAATQTRPSTGQPARGGSNARSSAPSSSSGTTVRQQSRQNPNQPGGSVNRNQPQPGMSVNPNAPSTVRHRESAPRNFEGGRGPSHVQMHPGPGHNMERIPPRRRDPMPFNRPVRFWDGGHHYFGYRVSYLPTRYVREVYWGVPYYVLDGIYYRYYGGHYYISRPPFGVYFDPVLDNLVYRACRFSYYYDVYNTYRTINENAQTIASQNATIAANNATIARQNADIALNTERAAKSYKQADRLGLVQSYADAGVEYFYDDGVFFIKNSDGKYVTIVPPAGALVQELPDDYETIILEGDEYYKVDDTVYKLTIIDGTPYFEVLGQLTGSLAEKYNQYNTL
ncbi:MAG: hypothetical protein K6G86_09085 [Bacteroidales bacterium]|nr:hypothetical protein [Bacteroidales bacterium]